MSWEQQEIRYSFEIVRLAPAAEYFNLSIDYECEERLGFERNEKMQVTVKNVVWVGSYKNHITIGIHSAI